MSRRVVSSDNQQSLFQYVPELTEVTTEIKECLNRISRQYTARDAAESRYTLAGKISHLLKRDISEGMLSNYLSVGKTEYTPHADFILAFCVVTNTIEPLDVMARHIGAGVVRANELIYIELAHLKKERERIEQKEKELQAKIA